MAKGLNLKAMFTADTKEIKKGSKEAQQAIQEFSSASEGVLDNFTNLFGTSMAGISASLKTAQGGLLMFSKSMKTATKDTTGLVKAFKMLKVAIAATGIGAIVTALASLISYFTKTQRGADMLSRALVPLKVIFNNLVDLASRLGEGIVNAFKNPKETILKFLSIIQDQLLNRFTAIVDIFNSIGTVIEGVVKFDTEKIKQGGLEFKDAFMKGLTGMEKETRQKIAGGVKDIIQENNEEIRKGLELERRRQQLEKDKIEYIKTRADIENKVAELRLKVEDRLKYSAEERAKYNDEALKVQKSLLTEGLRLAKEEYEIKVAQDELAENMNTDNEETANLYAQMVNLQTQNTNSLREMTTKQTELNNQVKIERAEREKIAALQQQRLTGTMKLEKPETPDFVKDFEVEAQVKPSIDPDAVSKLRDEVDGPVSGVMLDLSAAINDSLSTLATGIGETLGLMMSGEGSFEQFASMVAGTFADMAISVGKMAIQTGIATLGIKKALESLNPYVAIAAGVALVALGTAVKASMKGLASGASSAGTGVLTAGGTFDIPSNNLETKDRSIEVTGTLVASGDSLVAVIDSTNNRRNYIGR